MSATEWTQPLIHVVECGVDTPQQKEHSRARSSALTFDEEKHRSRIVHASLRRGTNEHVVVRNEVTRALHFRNKLRFRKLVSQLLTHTKLSSHVCKAEFLFVVPAHCAFAELAIAGTVLVRNSLAVQPGRRVSAILQVLLEQNIKSLRHMSHQTIARPEYD